MDFLFCRAQTFLIKARNVRNNSVFSDKRSGSYVSLQLVPKCATPKFFFFTLKPQMFLCLIFIQKQRVDHNDFNCGVQKTMGMSKLRLRHSKIVNLLVNELILKS